MSVRNLFLICATALLITQPLHAQSEARIKIVAPGVDRLKDDLKYLVELSPTKQLKDQWKKTLDPLLDSFAQGLDPAKPMRIDMVFGKPELAYEMHFPLKQLDGPNGFLENLSGFGYNNKWNKKKPVPVLFELIQGKGNKLKTVGFLRDANKYASIAPTQAAVPANLPNPITPELLAYLAKGYDVAAEMKNDPKDKKGMASRLANFTELRKQLEAGVTFKRDEDKNEFELRKMVLFKANGSTKRDTKLIRSSALKKLLLPLSPPKPDITVLIIADGLLK